ncbi:MAG: phenylalanine 4-monooxygenase [Gammaproteobacteria bacterium]
MYKQTKYVSKSPDKHGFVAYTYEENQIWHDLYVRQMKTIENRACNEYIEGLKILGLTKDAIPQLPDVNKALDKATGWAVAPVNALIQFEEFFDLLANRKFPAATFIRTREDFDYIKEPDIFHELYGHCPMLTNPIYADFMRKYGELALKANHKERVLLARLYWFTVEFGLINAKEGLRIYGGGILSSHKETIYATDSNIPKRVKLDSLEAFRTPYRIDILQPIYFVINSFDDLYSVIHEDLIAKIHESQALGEYPPLFEKNK